MWPELLSVCAAYDITLREIKLPDSFYALAEKVLNGTSDYYDAIPECLATYVS